MDKSPGLQPIPDSTRSEGIRAWEYAALLPIVVTSWVVYLRYGQHVWFHADYWGLLLNHNMSLRGLLEPHAGHLAIFHVAAVQLTYLAARLDAWKWLVLLRMLIWASLVGVSWFIARRRGADPVVALAYAASISVFGLSGWVMGWLIGNPIAIIAILSAAFLIEGRRDPSLGRRTAVGLLGGVAIISTGVGVVGLIALAVAAVTIPAARRYLLPLAASAILYVPWYLVVRGSTGGPPMDFSALRDIPWNLLQITTDGVASYVGVSFAFGGVLLVGLALAIAISYRHAPLSVFDMTMALWIGGFVTLVSITRIAAGQARVHASRYEYLVLLALLAIVVPRLRLTILDRRVAAAATIVVIAAGLFVTRANAIGLKAELAFWQSRSLASRQIVEAAGWMLDRGEPYADRASVDGVRAGMLTAGGLATVAEDGWDPPPPQDDAIESSARGNIRLYAPRRLIATFTNCSRLNNGDQLILDAMPFSIETSPGGGISVQYVDGFGIGDKTFETAATIYPVTDPLAIVIVGDGAGSTTVCRGRP